MTTRNSRITKWFFYLMLLPIVVAFSGWQGWRWWSWAISPVMSASAEARDRQVLVEIGLGTSGQQIGTDLADLDLIRSEQAWNIWAKWLRLQAKLKPELEGYFQAGTYQLSPTQSLPEIAAQIRSGTVIQTTYTIPEGWTLAQMGDYFEDQGFFTSQEFLEAVNRVSGQDYPWLPSVPKLEGFLFPDTYQISGDNLTADRIVQQMLTQFERVALPLYQKAQAQTDLSLLEWVTLASIVEKESVVAQERGVISGVFHNRLRTGMTLGADPTVEYGLGIKQTPDQPLTLKDVNTPNPYNTYLNPGLPPTPIAAPGTASLEATLYPETTEYLYFVARYDGTHIFSRTLNEHNQAINQVAQQR
ncbi:MAG: endolytic transglycosylase MltG [Roseofilum sp. SBFL]|uniref:endolytic transglycosylase MltG n=1 Tax=unclassified Roseofilum TaxID=2620099 RepID=UPI001B2C41AD|nr:MULTISPECIES: endolytic transglycosylase MltG [unclassified Roseofilum]MBP0012504.1 endolytic transglycosylase MltG [Roseofilum sp. SID3]MBP0037587.1 endolytic transglycosylase MltG [Roseofilum sp. SID1]MBP0041855.1 endolytic transglycosylase MltG [Roseofilum sp. SBFL]